MEGRSEPAGAHPAPRGERARVLPLLAALLVVAPGLYWVAVATWAASLSPLGRDQGIFQYFAWALREGDVLYRDIRDVNGPLTTLVHLVFQALGGEDEHRFRVLDLAVTGGVFALAGACLPGLGAPAGVRPAARLLAERAAWAAAAWVVVGAQYLSHLYWDIAQRETFAGWFLLSSIAAQVLASSLAAPRRGALDGRARRLAAALTAMAGALAAVTWFGKPTFVLFTPAQVLALLLDDEHPLGWKARLGAYAGGALAGASVLLALLLGVGDLASFVRIAIVEAPVLYRYIWAQRLPELFAPGYARLDTALGLVGCAIAIALVATRRAPRRLLAIGLLPLGAIANLVVQRKGFAYHHQPIGAAARLVWLALLVLAAERAWSARAAWSVRSALSALSARPSRALVRAAPLALGAALGLFAALQARTSPHAAMASALSSIAATPEGRASEAYFALYPESHYRPWEMRLAARYVAERTSPDARVQVYGMDPYFLFLARRLSATPYVYAYDLNVSAALLGGSGARPDALARRRILDMQRRHERDLLARMRERPPGAFVFIEHAPMTSFWDDGPRDFETSCPEAAAWVWQHYREAARFGVVRVFLPATAGEGITAPEGSRDGAAARTPR
ncbi:hypothetical protein WMF18_18430 [Sorangium sp. So ce315]|uniref:hypothetical protein n=1 Tax=Sorangium sp. So ce315 TaxID=3133299 RepID=UPI003F604970